jgi:predicted MFS family arabinose efflux permease
VGPRGIQAVFHAALPALFVTAAIHKRAADVCTLAGGNTVGYSAGRIPGVAGSNPTWRITFKFLILIEICVCLAFMYMQPSEMPRSANFQLRGASDRPALTVISKAIDISAGSYKLRKTTLSFS